MLLNSFTNQNKKKLIKIDKNVFSFGYNKLNVGHVSFLCRSKILKMQENIRVFFCKFMPKVVFLNVWNSSKNGNKATKLIVD